MGMYAAEVIDREGRPFSQVKNLNGHTRCYGDFEDRNGEAGCVVHFISHTANEVTRRIAVDFLNSDFVNRMTDGAILAASEDLPKEWWDGNGDLKPIGDFELPRAMSRFYVRVDMDKPGGPIINALRMAHMLVHVSHQPNLLQKLDPVVAVLVACARIGHNFYCDSYVSMIPVTAGQYREQCEKEGIEVDDSYLTETMAKALGLGRIDSWGDYVQAPELLHGPTLYDIQDIMGRTRETFKRLYSGHKDPLWQGYTKDCRAIEELGLDGYEDDDIISVSAGITYDLNDKNREQYEVMPLDSYEDTLIQFFTENQLIK
ncbi:hypothetical protein [Pseudomonas phage ZCPS1]|uniref:Uncharacterized protein n=2 Tax=Viruses TaxID=10239 RepID=A0A0B5A6G2_9CAUD|nr:hypothetical protein AVV32_gp23 [Pseudomonas phage PhiCHU]AJD82716.1 hypothetical protein PhiCHU_23 [Pseudomonas phage PhiCHU]UPO63123.1 hypothetical protein [Pseudomonas phage ZCPS1]